MARGRRGKKRTKRGGKARLIGMPDLRLGISGTAGKQPYIPIGGIGLTTAQLRGEPTELMTTRTQRRRAQRAGVTGKITAIHLNSSDEFSLVTDLRKTINKLTGKPASVRRDSRRRSSEDSDNSDFETKREEILHTRTKPEDVPRDEKKLWNVRRPGIVRRAQQQQITDRNTCLNSEVRRKSNASSHNSEQKTYSILKKPKTRTTSNELLMSDVEDEFSYYGNRQGRPSSIASRSVKQELSEDEYDVRETDIMSRVGVVTRRRSSTMLQQYSVQNEIVPEPVSVEPEVILPPPKNLPPADINDGSIIAFHEAGVGSQVRPAHSKTLIAKATRHIYQQ